MYKRLCKLILILLLTPALVVPVPVFAAPAPALAAAAEQESSVPGAEKAIGAPRNVILSWTGATDSTVTVTWHGDKAAGTGSVYYGTDPALTSAMEISAVPAARTSGIPLEDTVWQATLTGLSPNTRYYYAAANDDVKSGVADFTTGGKDLSAFSFLYMGDIQTGTGSADDWSALLSGAREKHPSAAFGVFGGDMVDSGISVGQWQDLLQRAAPVFSDIPLMMTNGNHESNFPDGKPKLYLDLFGLPQNGPAGFHEEFYSFDYGNCHITVLNSWVFSGEQKLTDADHNRIKNWIIADLAGSSAPWKIVVMHHPIYTLAGDRVSDAVRENWAPLLEKGGVSLILCGHQHVYSRSHPMTGGQIDYEDGVTTVMGNASQKFYSTADETYQARTAYNIATYQIIRIDGDTLTLQSFDGKGTEIDHWVTSPRKDDDAQKIFSDVSNSDRYASAVNYVAARGLMSGTSERGFSPETTVSRAMAAVLLHRLAGSPAAEGKTGSASGLDSSSGPSSGFSDVPANVWYGQAVSWLSENGILYGTGGGRFSPGAPVTGEQLGAMLSRLVQYEKGGDAAVPMPPEIFSAETGAPAGLSAAPLTRAQCAQILKNFCLAYAW